MKPETKIYFHDYLKPTFYEPNGYLYITNCDLSPYDVSFTLIEILNDIEELMCVTKMLINGYGGDVALIGNLDYLDDLKWETINRLINVT